VPDPSSYRPASGSIPESPGVYRFRDSHGLVIYVGKAKNLRSRLNSYFADLAALHPRTQAMVTTAGSVDWVVVSTEVEALQLEYSWIKEYDPRFNVRYRDDKSYPNLAVTLGEDYPRLQVMRGSKKKGVRYFGPYAHAWAIRETLDLLLRVFPARTCSAGVFRRAEQIGRPCLLGDIGKCSAPCVGRVSKEQHRAIVDDFCDFMAGKTDRMVRRLERLMRQAAAELDFERAARLRDDLSALQRAMEKQAVVLPDGTDADVIAFAADPFEAAVQVFHVRGGRVRGQRGWVIERIHEENVGELVEQFCLQIYGEATDAGRQGGGTAANDAIPREVLVEELPEDWEALAELLTFERGAQVTLRIPQRGDKRALLETVRRNAEQALAQHKLKRSTDLTARSAALAELQEHLGLSDAPLRIECYDVSHISGSDPVASMVVFEDGIPRKSEYRKFAIAEPLDPSHGHDDTAAMAQVLRRRFSRYLQARDSGGGGSVVDPQTGRPKSFAYPPNLVVVDGGLPQANAASQVLGELGITDVALCGLAKRLEEVWLPEDPFPVILPRNSEALYLLQRVRDEAHRFAISFHRAKRSKRLQGSELDSIPGLGKTRRAALLRHFGSVRKLRTANVGQLADVAGIGPALARSIVAALTDAGAAPSNDGLGPAHGADGA
jgi:excinuclease ABC subunit C